MSKASTTTKLGHEERISQLRENLFYEDGRSEMGEISPERVRILTKFYQENDGLPAELKRAGALDAICEQMSIRVIDGELIVGNSSTKQKSVEMYPEFGVDWLLDGLDTFSTREADKFLLSEADKEELRTLLPWWKGRTVEDRTKTILGEDEEWYTNRLIFHSSPDNCAGQNGICPDVPKILEKGLKGILNEVEEKLQGLDLTYAANFEKSVFYRSVISSLKACIKYANRFAALLRGMASDESNPYRKQELEKMAEVCAWVPENPARSYHEALQSYWFIHTCIGLEAAPFLIVPGRLDQYFYPYYRDDIEAGKITKDEAQELLECLWIKFNESMILLPPLPSIYYSGQPLDQDVTIGGVDEYGFDATNELTYMVLDAEKKLQMRQPELLVPIHKDAPDDLLKSACELVRHGTGKPKFVCLDTLINLRLADPFPYSLKEVRNLVWTGCGETTIPGIERPGVDANAWANGLPTALELALNNGVNRLSGEQWGPETGDASKFTSYDQVMEAFKKQYEHMMWHRTIHSDAINMSISQVTPSPLKSAFIYDCIGKGLDLSKGGAKYNADIGTNIGLTTCADAFAALKKVVFEDKELTLPELLDALEANFEGKEEIRQKLLDAPKYGNDDDYVDLICRDLGQMAYHEHRKYPHIHGGFHRGTHSTVTAGIAVGRMVGATPDGRKAGDALNEGGTSPHQGRDKKGPAAVMKSVSKIDWLAASGGVLNIKFDTKALEGDEGIDKLVALLRAYDDMGGFHVQINCVDSATLKAAQKNPEKYRDLMIRVGAYSSYFVQVSRALQDDIIARTEHGEVY